jgi:indole-3-glycerol phosphate synthase
MSNFLSKIVETRKRTVEEARSRMPLEQIRNGLESKIPALDFKEVFQSDGIHIIAEIKRASPSKGALRPELIPAEWARMYESFGAAAISVLTEKDHFSGSIDDMVSTKKAVGLPVLRKDFIFDEYQVYESRFYGADSFLLIASILSQEILENLIKVGRSLGMEPLVEVHDKKDLMRALKSDCGMIGINNRNLKDFSVNLNTTLDLIHKIPQDRVIISESGIKYHHDIIRLHEAGVKGFLIGERLVRSSDPGSVFEELMNGPYMSQDKSENLRDHEDGRCRIGR